jgi:hypothetical protein
MVKQITSSQETGIGSARTHFEIDIIKIRWTVDGLRLGHRCEQMNEKDMSLSGGGTKWMNFDDLLRPVSIEGFRLL